MQRPDKDIIRRILTQAKKATLPRPDSFKNTKKNVEVALTLPLISLTDDFFNSSPIIDWYYDDFLTQGGRDHEVAELGDYTGKSAITFLTNLCFITKIKFTLEKKTPAN